MDLVRQYLEGGASDERLLNRARRELPNCFTSEEIHQMGEYVACEYPDDFGDCPGTCGNYTIASIIFSGFLAMSNFILLNLVMAVLMQELSSAISSSDRKKTTETLSVLVGVSQATAKWLKYAGEDMDVDKKSEASSSSGRDRKPRSGSLRITGQGERSPVGATGAAGQD
jgi:hypothetical protein